MSLVQGGEGGGMLARLPGRWRLLLLSLRVRLVGWTLLGLLVLAGVVLGGVAWQAESASRMVNFILVALVPLLAAALVAGTLTTPWAEVERTVPAPLARWRLWQMSGLVLVAAPLLALVCAGWPEPFTGWIVLRNVAGASGLALLTAALVGGRLAWLGPAFGGALLAGADVDAALRWVWPAVTWREWAAMLLPPLVLLAGLLLVTVRQVPLRVAQSDEA